MLGVARVRGGCIEVPRERTGAPFPIRRRAEDGVADVSLRLTAIAVVRIFTVWFEANLKWLHVHGWGHKSPAYQRRGNKQVRSISFGISDIQHIGFAGWSPHDATVYMASLLEVSIMRISPIKVRSQMLSRTHRQFGLGIARRQR